MLFRQRLGDNILIQFTYRWYRNLLTKLQISGYKFRDYQTMGDGVILRHDIDTSLEQAVKLSTIEAQENAISTWFVLLATDFYNIFTIENRDKLRILQANGGEIGLHFDEMQYQNELFSLLQQEDDSEYCNAIVEKILWETNILSEIIGCKVNVVSMHRPSKKLLKKNLCIPGMVNSYGHQFIKEYKYISDSRMNWREDIEKIIESRCFSHLHILTHAFWYHDEQETMHDILFRFCNNAKQERYNSLSKNITMLDEILHVTEV